MVYLFKNFKIGFEGELMEMRVMSARFFIKSIVWFSGVFAG